MNSFKLTDILSDSILFAMENQDVTSFVDPDTQSVVTLELLSDADEFEANADNWYSLPEWTSDDGFELMEEFTENLRTPTARRELRQAITGGRGVFRNFKNVLKKYPEVEKLWFAFKNKKMHARITEWYNDLCESWGLEKMEFSDQEIDSSEDLVETDFQFLNFDFSKNNEELSHNLALIADEYNAEQFGKIITGVILNKKDSAARNSKGFICRTQDGEFAGCALYHIFSEDSKSAEVDHFFVNQNYRGLGIGTELISRCISKLMDDGIQNLIFSNIFISESLESLLNKLMFTKSGSIYIKDFPA